MIKEIYRGEEWIGGLFPKGINPGGKFNVTYNSDNNNQELFLILVKPNIDLIEIKKQIRLIFKNHHCIHSTDFFNDTFRLASSLLNNNSIHYLNTSKLNISNSSDILLQKYYKFLEDVDNADEYCLTSSIILELYGLRQAKDIDYLQVNDTNMFKNQLISCHKNIWLEYYHTNKETIIFDPENYFYFNGYKVATLNVLKEMKQKRNEQKDIIDISLINKIIN